MNEIILFNLSMIQGEDYEVHFSYTDDDENPVSMKFWTVESTLREFNESNKGYDFLCTSDDNGIHLYMSHNDTKKIGFNRGRYDVFVTDPENNLRIKLVAGLAYIEQTSNR